MPRRPFGPLHEAERNARRGRLLIDVDAADEEWLIEPGLDTGASPLVDGRHGVLGVRLVHRVEDPRGGVPPVRVQPGRGRVVDALVQPGSFDVLIENPPRVSHLEVISIGSVCHPSSFASPAARAARRFSLRHCVVRTTAT